MMPRVLRIGCKVNLYLDITGVREDGYHELETLFYPVAAPFDVMEIIQGGADGHALPDAPAGTASGDLRGALPDASGDAFDGRPAARVGQGMSLWCSDQALETPANIVAKAYEAYARATGYRPELTVRLAKGIPSGAGLGGGSADAAALLGWLNARAGDKALSSAGLCALAAKLGADVPFFLLGRPAWATGIGEILTPARCDLSGLTMLVCMPREQVNTAWAYRAWDEAAGFGGSCAASPVLTRLCPPSMRPFCVSGTFIANCFEAVVFKRHPAVRLLKERLLELGARAAGMSGSGSAVFGLFRNPARADAAVSALKGPETTVFSALL